MGNRLKAISNLSQGEGSHMREKQPYDTCKWITGRGSTVWEFDRGTLGCLHFAVSFKVVREITDKRME